MKRRRKQERFFNPVEQYRTFGHEALGQMVIGLCFCIFLAMCIAALPVFSIGKSLALETFGEITLGTIVEKPKTAPYGSYVNITQQNGKPLRIHIPDAYHDIGTQIEILHFPRFPRFLVTTPELNKIDWFNNLGILLTCFVIAAPFAWELFKVIKAYRTLN